MDRIAPWLQTNWDRRAAGNFIGGGTGAGLAIFAAASELTGGNPQRWTYLLAAIFIAAGLSLVWIEIGRPWRFLHVFFNPHTSWMTREGLVALPLLVALAAAAWYGGAALASVAALLALVFVYCQARILRASRGIPAWRDPSIVPLIGATALAEGVGAWFVLNFVAGAAPGGFVLVLALLALLARWIAWTAYRRSLTRRGAPTASRKALQAIGLQLLVLGTIAPIVLIAASLGFADYARPLALAAGLLGLAEGWLIKDTIVLRAAFNQGFAVPHMPRLNPASGDSGIRQGWS